MGFTRSDQQAGTIYVINSDFGREGDDGAFYTPDGEGRIWYDSEDEARAEIDGEDWESLSRTERTKVVYLDELPEDY